MSKLADLKDIFFHLNMLNKSLQGFCTDMFALRNTTDVINKKLALWDSFAWK